MSNRSVFSELMKGVSAMKAHREGKATLRTFKVKSAPRKPLLSELARLEPMSEELPPISDLPPEPVDF